MTGSVLGWDVGGANLKAARVSCDRASAPTVLTIPFPLWREPGRLSAVLAEAASRLGAADAMAVTMTAELADCFATKREGVAFVLKAFLTAFQMTACGCTEPMAHSDARMKRRSTRTGAPRTGWRARQSSRGRHRV